jgi:hypothetical protein
MMRPALLLIFCLVLAGCFPRIRSMHCADIRWEKENMWRASEIEKTIPGLQSRSEYWRGAGDAYRAVEEEYCQ